jgi:choline dehydrogenase-like flavoprotein
MTITSFVTQLPLETNADDRKNMEFFRQKSIEILQAAGATKVWAPPVGEARGGAHNRGTCRMGNDPRTSVVDKCHKAHDVPNLFIVDGSNFVTGGAITPL